MRFQRDISSSQATLPVVCAIALVLWFVLPSQYNPQEYLIPDYGLWQHLPFVFHDARYSLPLGILCAAIAVYIMVELKNKNLLLRVNSYMLSSTLALLLALSAPLHPLQPSSLIMLFTLYAYFPLFASYQMPYPLITFSIYLPLSLASLFFPQFLFIVPVYWCLQIYLRSFSFRSFLASIIAVILPYWFYGGIAIVTDTLPQFIAHFQPVTSLPDLFSASFITTDFLHSIIPFLILPLLMLLVGSIDFQLTKLLDKTRTRSFYNVVQWHAISLLFFIMLYHRHTATLLPLVILDTSILYGHFFTLTHTRFSHIINIIILVLMMLLLVMQFANVLG
ncbi:MAG: hypothetical protein J1F40_05570 [Prevotellaceae bacterium]|nr:hypothetical protein [Prevotellaceae bacterium]